MLGGTPVGGLGGEDITNPDYANIVPQEQQLMEADNADDQIDPLDQPFDEIDHATGLRQTPMNSETPF